MQTNVHPSKLGFCLIIRGQLGHLFLFWFGVVRKLALPQLEAPLDVWDPNGDVKVSPMVFSVSASRCVLS